MKTTSPARAVVKVPNIHTLTLPGINEYDAGIQDYGWHKVNELVGCIRGVFGSYHPDFAAIDARGIFERFSHLNTYQGDGLITWVAARKDAPADYAILGAPPPDELYREEGVDIYAPARWGMNVLNILPYGITRVFTPFSGKRRFELIGTTARGHDVRIDKKSHMPLRGPLS